MARIRQFELLVGYQFFGLGSGEPFFGRVQQNAQALDHTLAAMSWDLAHWRCLLDQRFFDFVGLEPEALKAQLAVGMDDAAVLQWILEHSERKLSGADIEAWSAQAEHQAPSEAELQQVLSERCHGQASDGVERLTWFELLERNDRLSFGGKP
jgi:hypothetical protein